MKNLKRFMLVALAMILVGSMASCKHPGFKKHETGFYYKFYEQNDTAVQPQIGDVITMMYTMRTTDSTLDGPRPMQIEILDQIYEGDIFEAIKMMHVGDSATFILNADTFFHYFMGQEFTFETKNHDLYFDIKLMNVMPKVEVEALRQQQMEQQRLFFEQLKNSEDSLRIDYMTRNNINAKPTESGLYIIHTQQGTGAQAEAGKTVSVHYTGRLLFNDEEFDSSIRRNQPFEFVLGEGKVIKGWEEGIATMKEGGKATFIIPSSLGYGADGAYPVIPPYSTLIFDVELLSVK